ncbi:23S rRNA (uracil(1939)-C(5))-methyltransferase RlmD [sulfur-oxidizing endosymbiont of Gigantopelta aegis]|uniref:23S rRNA (uracil(1939)-C(5))-methyltransferase RlmD n=1 Tax=sulfur-oxidizing endosymbiont of Gigantopelta aegis TaxID=2794934 RepID=UPI0018DD2FFB|nr:23S rRNA (uracil(1939)-C(5))-methyltransferase RlmD [sulfur-oxidizing endosymbiont of Gigantopelta aegis]
MARRRRRAKLPQDPITVTIESVSHDGKGVCHVDDMTVFIDGALEGEEISFIYTNKRKNIGEGKVHEIIKASPLRVEPECEHFSYCGGCSLQHLADDQQILLKQGIMLDNLKHLGKSEPETVLEPLRGPHWGYRTKARLGVRFVVKKDKMLVGFREKHSNFLAELETCKVLHPDVGLHLRGLSELILSLSIYKQIPQIEVAYGDDQGAFIVRHLAAFTEEDLQKISAYAEKMSLHIYLQSKGPDTVIRLYPPLEDDDNKTEGTFQELSYALPEYDIVNYFRPTDFTQVNMEINRKMIDLALELMAPKANDKVLDLFCGLGNFTLPIARQVAHVTGVEGSSELVIRAKENALRNGIVNTDYFAADLFEDFATMKWAQQQYDCILLDPARSGAMAIVEYLPKFGAKTVVYVSCNPSTLARDTEIMVHKNGYTLVKAGVMDMFPHTSHVESIALFMKK